jgi:hypothetical protein
VECVRHHAVPRKAGFLPPVKMSLTSRGFAEGDARAASLCRAKYAVVAKNTGAVSGLAKPFPGRNWRREQRPVRWRYQRSSVLTAKLGIRPR